MKTTDGSTECNVSVNQDGQIVWRTGRVETPTCQHIFDPVVLTRGLSLAIARAVIAAQDATSALLDEATTIRRRVRSRFRRKGAR